MIATATEAARVRRASASDTPDSTMRLLTDDPSPMVRAALAMNPATPPGLHRLLGADLDERVRSLLGRKLAGMLPRLSQSHREEVARQARETLERLVGDETARVRAAIADVVKDMPDAPRELILRLARDSAVGVSGPVIRLSPLLTAEDLLGLLARPPTLETPRQIAGRPNLEAAVCDAIAATADPSVIAEMLANPSAAIREATLDALVDRAAEQTAWHAPLVRRPALTGRAAWALSDMVADELVGELSRRADLPPTLAAELRQRLARVPAGDEAARPTVSREAAWLRATRMAADKTLDEDAMLIRVEAGETVLCVAMLAVAAGVAVDTVERAMSLRSAKGLMCLVHAAGWTIRAAKAVQTLLGKIPPGMVLGSTAEGAFPLSDEEMRWQLDLLKRPRK